MVSFRGQKKLGPHPDWSSLGGLIQNFRQASPSLSYAESPPPTTGLNYLNFRSVLGYSQCIKRGSTTGVNEPIIKQKGIPYYTIRKKITNKKMSHSKLLKK